MLKTLYDFTEAFKEIVSDALINLSPEDFQEFKDSIPMIFECKECGSNLDMFLNTSKSGVEWWEPVKDMPSENEDLKLEAVTGINMCGDGYYIKPSPMSTYCNMVGGCAVCTNGACWRALKKV